MPIPDLIASLEGELERLHREAAMVRAALRALGADPIIVAPDVARAAGLLDEGPPVKQPAPRRKAGSGTRVPHEKIRDAARRLGRFTAAELADDLGISRGTAATRLRQLASAGTVTRHGGQHDPKTYYEFVRPEGGGPRSAPRGEPDLSVIGVGAASQAGGEPVAGVRNVSPQLRGRRRGPMQSAAGRQGLRVQP